MKERWPYPKQPRPDYQTWPRINQLELNWILCKLRLLRAENERLALFRKCFSDSCEYKLRAQSELYSLLTASGREFNRVVFKKEEDYRTDPDGPWPFLYWSYIRRNARVIGSWPTESYEIGAHFMSNLKSLTSILDSQLVEGMLIYHRLSSP